MRSNQHHQDETAKEFEQELSFQEWLDHFAKEPTIEELNDMEKSMSTTYRINRFNPFNNIHYRPLQGA